MLIKMFRLCRLVRLVRLVRHRMFYELKAGYTEEGLSMGRWIPPWFSLNAEVMIFGLWAGVRVLGRCGASPQELCVAESIRQPRLFPVFLCICQAGRSLCSSPQPYTPCARRGCIEAKSEDVKGDMCRAVELL